MKTIKELMGLEEADKMKGEDPCWDTHQMVGMKMKNGRKVPNCVPKAKPKNEEVELDEAKVGDTVSFHHELKSAPGSKVKNSGTVEKVDGDVVHVKVKDKYGVKRHQIKMGDLVKEETELEEASDTKRPPNFTMYPIDRQDYKILRPPKKTPPKSGKEWGRDGGEKKLKEETEQIDEMDKSAPQPGRDGKVSHSTYGSRDRDDKDDYFKGKESLGKRVTVKQAEKDALKILNKQYAKEETEQIDELNKDTLYSYNKKADADIEKKHKSLGQLMRRGDAAGANKAAHQLNKRVAGMERAEKRLNAEEVELDELRNVTQDHLGSRMGSSGPGFNKTPAGKESEVKRKQEHLKGQIQSTKSQGGIAGPKGKLPEEVELEEAEAKKVRMTPQERAYKRKIGKKAVSEPVSEASKVETAAQVTKHFEKGQSTPSGVPKWVAEPVDNPKLADKFMKAFRKMKTAANVSCKTYGTVSTCEETELDEAAKAKMKGDPSQAKNVKKGEPLSGKQEPVKLNPELQEK